MTNSDQNHGRPPVPGTPGYPHRSAPGQPQQMAPDNHDPRFGALPPTGQYAMPGVMPQHPGQYPHGTPAYPQEQPPFGGAQNVPAMGQGGYGQMQQGAGGDYYYPQGQQGLPEVPTFAMPPGMHPQRLDAGSTDPLRMPAYEPATQAYHGGAESYRPGTENQLQPAMEYGQPGHDHGTVQQISQRLAQLQSQYEVDVARMDPRQGHVPADGAGGVYGNPGHYYPQQGYPHQPGQNQPPIYANMQQQPPAPEHANYHEQAQTYAHQADQSHSYAHQSYEQAYRPQQTGEYAGAPSGVQGNGYAAPYQQEGHAPYAAGTVIAHHEPSAKGSRNLAMAGAFIGALAIGGGAAYTYKFTDLLGNRGSDIAAPVVKAGAVPVKVVNGQPAERRAPQDRPLHERMTGGGEEANGSSERFTTDGSEGAPKVASAATGMLPKPEAGSGTADSGAPRRVKTLIVRPDGTILQPTDTAEESPTVATGRREAQEAAAELAPNMPDARKAAVKPSSSVPKAVEEAIRKPETAKIAAATEKSAEKQATTLMVQRAKPEPAAKQVKTAAIDAKTAVSTGGGSESAAEVGDPYVVQVTSKDSPTSALAAFADLQQKYPSLIGSYEPDIERADLGEKGVWYRLRVGPVAGKTAASDLCTRLKAAGHAGCFARRK